MKSKRLFFFLKSEWAFRRNPKTLMRLRRLSEKKVRQEQQTRVKELDGKIEAEKKL